MARLTLKDLAKLAPWARDQVMGKIAELPPDERPAPPRTRTKKAETDPSHWYGKEKDLQAAVDDYLTSIGFVKRTSKVIQDTAGKGGELGWQLHISRAVGNPYLLDVLLLAHDGRWFEFELKTAHGKLSALQEALAGDRVCRSLAEVVTLVESWLHSKK